MKHPKNDVKQKHHAKLIYDALVNAFPDCEVHRPKHPDGLGDTFTVYEPRKGISYELSVGRAFLVDSRPDSSVERAAARAAGRMRANPGKRVRISYGPKGGILVEVVG